MFSWLARPSHLSLLEDPDPEGGQPGGGGGGEGTPPPEEGEPPGAPGEGEEFDYKGGYTYLKSEVGKQGNVIGSQKKQIEQLSNFVNQLYSTMPQQQQGQQMPTPDAMVDQFVKNPQSWWQQMWDQSSQQLHSTLSQVMQQQQVLNFKLSCPDYEKYVEAMDGILQKNPQVTQLPNFLFLIYQQAKAEEMQKGYGDAAKENFEKGQDAVRTKEQLKERAATGGGKTGKKKIVPSADDPESLRGLSTAEMEKVLPHADTD